MQVGGSIMLCQFTFKNFKSFKNQATLDLYAENIGEHTESLLVDQNDNERILPVISIYGPNGSGKSNVLEAFAYFRYKIIFPVISLIGDKMAPDDSEDKDYLQIKPLPTTGDQNYYKFDTRCKEQPVEFSIICRVESFEYNYQINFLNGIILEENFYRTNLKSDEPELIFERILSEKKEYIFNYGDTVSNISATKIKRTIPLISYLTITTDIEPVDKFVMWLLSCITLDFDDPERDRLISIPELEEDKNNILVLLNNMGIDISDIKVIFDEDNDVEEIHTVRNLSTGNSELDFSEESSGTRKVMSLLPHIYKCLQGGNLVIADEMDAKLHPKLFGYIISLFTDPLINKKNAQLICTSHDLYNMNKERFRRDEIWFCSMNANFESKLYSLVQFKMANGTKPRNDGSYSKQYIEGKFGADPYIRKGLKWEDIDE